MKILTSVLFGIALMGNASAELIPPDRLYPWNPGLMSLGGIPNRTTVCATVPLGNGLTNDAPRIQAALDRCPPGQVVQLVAGRYVVNNSIMLRLGITLRGAGAGVTILDKTNGAPGRSTTPVAGTNPPIYQPVAFSWPSDSSPLVILGQTRYPTPDNSTSVNLTADGVKGATSVTVASASGFQVGRFVMIDEDDGSYDVAHWRALPPNYNCNGQPTPCPPQVWEDIQRGTEKPRVSWRMHLPRLAGDNSGGSDATGPYDGSPGDLPGEMRRFNRPARPINQIIEVTAINGNTLTFNTPLSITFRVSNRAQITRYSDLSSKGGGNSVQVKMAGVEGFTARGGSGTTDSTIYFSSCAYCWAKGVEVTEYFGYGIGVTNSFRVEIRDSYVHTASWPEPGGNAYSISLNWGSSDVLVENNITRDANKNIVCLGGGSGSVISYNYFDAAWIKNSPTFLEVGDNCSHGTGPHHVLHEGNWAQNAGHDYQHGSGLAQETFFRGVYLGYREGFAAADSQRDKSGNPNGFPATPVDVDYGAWGVSFIGNILGYKNPHISKFTYTDPSMGCDAKGDNCVNGKGQGGYGTTIYRYGGNDPRMLNDTAGNGKLLRCGNYDFVTNSQKWHDCQPQALPNSLYLTSKPAFFGSNPWPYSDPSTGAVGILPARQRFLNGTPNSP